MRYIAIDVSGCFDRVDRTGSTSDDGFDLNSLFLEGFALYADTEAGQANAAQAKRSAREEYFRAERKRAYGR